MATANAWALPTIEADSRYGRAAKVWDLQDHFMQVSDTASVNGVQAFNIVLEVIPMF